MTVSVFEPATVRALLKSLQPPKSREKFIHDWDINVRQRVESWKKSHDSKKSPYNETQLQWVSAVVEYVTLAYNTTRIHGNSKSLATKKVLAVGMPYYGPRFHPPTFRHLQARSTKPITSPEAAYLKPVHIVHPFFYPELAQCPHCSATGKSVHWDSWTTTGPREILGIWENEYALGYQLRCDRCKLENVGRGNTRQRREISKGDTGNDYSGEGEDDTHCIATTSYVFWSKWEFWKIPDGLPIFFHRTGLTRELFDLITEFRLNMTSGGLAENIKQLHLQVYHKRQREYLNMLTKQIGTDLFHSEPKLKVFSQPDDVLGYNDKAITADLVTDVLLEFNRRSREGESSDYMRTLSGICVGFDWTFKSALKATVVEKSSKKRRQILKGGILVANNEKGETIGFRFCQTALHGELVEFLQGIKKRCDGLQVPHPELFAVDDCCKLRNPIILVFVKALIVLDVWHFQERYLSTVSQGTKNPYRSAVAHDIVNAILIERADGRGGVAKYRNKEDQEIYLQEAFQKWTVNGGVWTEASIKVHIDQLAHVKKGCLSRPRQDIATDGSRMESGNKGWGSLMNGNPCGVEVFNALSHDHVLRRNVRMSIHSQSPSAFVKTTHGSHHIRLVSSNNSLWNDLVAAEEQKALLNSKLYNTKDLANLRSTLRPPLPLIASEEKFGLIVSHTVLKQFDSSLTLENCDIQEIKDDPDGDSDAEGVINVDKPTSTASRPSGQPASGPSALSLYSGITNSSASTHPGPISSVVDLTTEGLSNDEIIDLTSDTTFAANTTTTMAERGVVSLEEALPLHGISPATGAKSRKRKFDAMEVVPPKSTIPVQDLVAAAPANPAMGLEDISSPTLPSMKRTRRMLASPESASSVNEDRPGVPSQRADEQTSGAAIAVTSGSSTLPREDTTVQIISTSTADLGVTQGTVLASTVITNSVSSSHHQRNIDTYFNTEPSTATLRTDRTSTPPTTHALPTRATFDPQIPAILTAKLSPNLSSSNTTPSERFFTLSTNVNSRAYQIITREEFLLFMNMRSELQWTTERMDTRTYAMAVKLYNTRLEVVCRTEGVPFVCKHARALMDKLAWAESTIYKKVSSGDYRSKSGRTEFWIKHCSAVELKGLRPRSALCDDTNEHKMHVSTEGISGGGQATSAGGEPEMNSGRVLDSTGNIRKGKSKAKAETNGKTKQDRCHRCKRLKYPGGVNSVDNHKKFFCADGVRLPPKRGSTVNVPDWPQPQGVYSEGGFFHPFEFLRTVRAIWRTLDDTEMYGRELNIEHGAFINFFNSHKLILHENDPERRVVLFRIEGLLERYTLSPHVPDLLVDHEGVKYLRVDSLSGSQQNASSIREESTVDPDS